MSDHSFSRVLHILVSSARPHLLGAQAYSIGFSNPHPFALRWHVAFQNQEDDPKGIHKVNEMLDSIQCGWVCFTADHNLIYPQLFQRLGQIMDENPDKKAIVVSNERRDPDYRVLVASPSNMVPSSVDGNQVFVKRELIGDLRFNWDRFKSTADGEFFMELYKRHAEHFIFINEILVSYRSMFWTQKGTIRE